MISRERTEQPPHDGPETLAPGSTAGPHAPAGPHTPRGPGAPGDLSASRRPGTAGESSFPGDTDTLSDREGPDDATAPDPLIRGRGLVKRYGGLTAVDHVDFDVRSGEFLGFLGPNGAGKTTLMKMVYCLVEPSGGSLHVFGREVREGARQIKARLGVVAQEDNLDPDLSVWDNLTIYARYYGMDGSRMEARARELLEFMELTAKRDKVIMHLSGGMKRRLAIARALLNQPEVVVLDEPTTGLDPQVRHIIWDRLLSLKEQGITFLLTTHYMEEAESLCDRLHVMDEGKFIASGRPLELIRRYVGEYVLELVAGKEEEARIAAECPGLERQRSGQRLYLYSRSREELMPLLESYAEAEARLRPASVEDVFLKLTGRGIRE